MSSNMHKPSRKSSAPVIVGIGSAVALTGKQPRGDKADGGAAGGEYKYASESPRE